MGQTNYNKLIYKDRINTIYDVVHNKGNIVHKQLYKTALNLYIKHFCAINKITVNEFNDIFRIIEKPAPNYDRPSTIVVCNKTANPSYKLKYIVDLTPFWPVYNYINKPTEVITINKSDNYGNDEITYIDYVKGTAQTINSYTGEKNEIKTNNITVDTLVSDDMIINKYGRD